MIYADKSVLDGIEMVATGYKTNTLFVVKHDKDIPEHNGCKLFEKEVYLYVWDKQKDAPKQFHDDVQDALRYAILTHMRKPSWVNHSL